MSNALAVAHVTQALALLIESNLRPEIDMAVSVETRKPPAEPPTEPTVTVFLYQLTHNPSMRNHDLPTRASDGTLVNKPVAALDLHYVISAYGEENELVGQRLIGCVARVMREFPVLPADVIEEAGERPHLAGSDLAESAQKVRFVPQQMDVDETSKLWGMLHQTPYTLSMTYQASLVLVEGREEPERSRPVQRTEVTVGASGVPGSGGSGGGTGGDSRAENGGSADGAGGAGGTGGGQGAGPSGAGGPGAPGVSVAPSSGGGADAAPGGGGPGAAAAPGGQPGVSAAGKRAAKKNAARTAAQKPAAKAAKKSAAKKSAAKATADKAAAKKSAAGKSAAGKSAATKASANRASAKKVSAKNASVKKSAARKQSGTGRTGRSGGAGNGVANDDSDGRES